MSVDKKSTCSTGDINYQWQNNNYIGADVEKWNVVSLNKNISQQVFYDINNKKKRKISITMWVLFWYCDYIATTSFREMFTFKNLEKDTCFFSCFFVHSWSLNFIRDLNVVKLNNVVKTTNHKFLK